MEREGPDFIDGSGSSESGFQSPVRFCLLSVPSAPRNTGVRGQEKTGWADSGIYETSDPPDSPRCAIFTIHRGHWETTEGKNKQIWKRAPVLFHRRQKPQSRVPGHMRTPLPGTESQRLLPTSCPVVDWHASPQAWTFAKSRSPAGVTPPPPQSVPPATPQICLAFRGRSGVLLKVDLSLLFSQGPCPPVRLQ